MVSRGRYAGGQGRSVRPARHEGPSDKLRFDFISLGDDRRHRGGSEKKRRRGPVIKSKREDRPGSVGGIGALNNIALCRVLFTS